MSKYYTDPATGQRVELKKTHKFRNFVVLPVVGFVAIAIGVNAASGGGTAPQPNSPGAPAPVAPAEQAVSPNSTLEVFGNGQAMVMVLTDGSSTNTVEMPHSQQLPEGYVSVSVSRMPSVEDFTANGGQPVSGSVGCRIVRDGEVIDEHTAEGQYASVTCSKFR